MSAPHMARHIRILAEFMAEVEFHGRETLEGMRWRRRCVTAAAELLPHEIAEAESIMHRLFRRKGKWVLPRGRAKARTT